MSHRNLGPCGIALGGLTITSLRGYSDSVQRPRKLVANPSLHHLHLVAVWIGRTRRLPTPSRDTATALLLEYEGPQHCSGVKISVPDSPRGHWDDHRPKMRQRIGQSAARLGCPLRSNGESKIGLLESFTYDRSGLPNLSPL